MIEVVTCVIPVHNEEKLIKTVLQDMPSFVKHIVIVNDASTDNTRDVILSVGDPRIILIDHPTQTGVGGAVASGYKKAIELESHIVVKVDGDGQMDLNEMSRLIAPIVNGKADYTKGVRFRDSSVVNKMPLIRLIGNIGLSFFTKIASGYWHVFDPTNGYTAISIMALRRLKLNKISRGYFLETDMLINLYRIRAVVMDVEMDARYGSETSGLNIFKVVVSFPLFLTKAFIKRILWQYFIMDFSAFSIFIISGSLLFNFGCLFGGYKWYINYHADIATPTGTIMLSVVPLILGFQLLLQALVLDINNVPKEPIQLLVDDAISH